MSASTETILQIRLLGAAGIEAAGIADNARIRQRNPLTVLSVIAGTHPRPVDRDQLAALLWPESDEARARNSLRQALYQIRSDAGDDVLVEDASGRLGLNPSHAKVDLWEFRDALENNRLDEAVEAYRGQFMDGFRMPGGAALEEWADGVRRELHLSYVEALDAIGNRATSEGRFDDAVALRRRLAAVNPLSSRVALSLLRALADAGDRAGALQYAAVYEALIRDRLDVEQDAAVTEFVGRLREDPGLRAYMAERQAERGTTPDARGGDAKDEGVEVAATAPASAVAGAGAVRTGTGPDDLAPTWISRLVAAVVLVGFGFVMGRWDPRAEPVPGEAGPASVAVVSSPDVGVIATGQRVFEDRDPNLMIVECEGPGCPAGPLPQNAWVVSKPPLYASAARGANFVSTLVDGTSLPEPGLPCCTTAVFELEFDVPDEAESARLFLTSVADNRAIYELNGVEFGANEGDFNAASFLEPAVFTHEFIPNRSGSNVLRITLENGGGLIALQFQGLLSYEGI